MEIHIQLAGVELGPYSEKQVRAYLDEGLLASTDPARFEGTPTWEKVEDVLGKMPAAAAAPPIALEKSTIPIVTPQSASTSPSSLRKALEAPPKSPAVTTRSLARLDPLSKDTIRVPMPQIMKSFGKLPSVEAKAPVAEPRPAAPSSVTPAVAPGKSSEKARTSLLTAVKILAKNSETRRLPAMPAPEAKSYRPLTPPITFPKSAEATRTLPMSMGRLAPSKTEPDDKPMPSQPLPAKPAAINPSSLPTASSALEDPKRTALLSPPKPLAKKPAQEAKPVPTVETPSAPQSPEVPITSSKSPQTLRTAPMTVVRALPKKTDAKGAGASQAIPAPPAPAEKSKESNALPAPEAVRFVSTDTPLPPGAVTKTVSSSDAAMSAKLLKRTTGSLPSLVKAMNKKPGEPAAKTASNRGLTRLEPDPNAPSETPVEEAPETSSPAPERPSFLKSFFGKFKRSTSDEPVAPEVLPEAPAITDEKVEAVEEKPEVPVEKPTLADKKPDIVDKKSVFESSLETAPSLIHEDEATVSSEKTKSRSLWPMVVGAVLIVLAGIGAYAYFYVQASYQSADMLLKALKEGNQAQLTKLVDFPAVRQSLKDYVTAQVAKSGTQNPGASVAMINNSIDFYVTPEAISALATKSNQLPKPGTDPTVTPALASAILLKLNDLSVKNQKLVAYNHLIIDLDAAKLDMVSSGSDWKLDRIDLNSDFPMPQEPGAPTPPRDLGASLVVPVIETYLADGQAKFEKSDWDGAIADYDQVLAIDSKQTVAYSNRGMAKREKNDLAGAIADFTQAISLDPKLAEAYDNRGDAKSAQNDMDGAIADYTQAVNLDPKMSSAFYNRGTIRTVKGDYDGAITDYTQDITLNPNHASAYSNRGFARQAENDLDGAIADYTQALAINPKIAIAYYNRGLAKQAKADLDGAILDYNHALDLDPKMTRAYYSRGIAKNTKNDLDGAIADYNQALTLDPKLAPALTDRALAKQAKGNLKEALADFNQVLEIDPKIAAAYYSRGLIKEQLNDLDGAIADSSRSLDLDPKRAQAYYNRGFAKLVKGNLDGARADLQKFCELASKDPYADHARLYLWLISMAQNPTGTANQDLSDALQNNWSLTPDDLVTKIAQFLLDRTTEADLIAAAASSDPKKDAGQHCEIWYFAGMKRLLAGDKTTAIDYFQKCLATGQKDYCEYILAQAELQVLLPIPVAAPTPTP